MPYTNDCSYENLNVIKFTNRNAKVNEIYIFVTETAHFMGNFNISASEVTILL